MVPDTANNANYLRSGGSAGDTSLARFFADSSRIEAERRRLIAFSLRAAGGIDAPAAEEIAQETLALAWQNRHNLRDSAAWQPYLTGIARNLCLRWRRNIAVNSKRSVDWDTAESTLATDAFSASTPDPYAELERSERESLLDLALSHLPAATHRLLIDRYISDLPVAEIAARRGVREETAAVQLYRSRAALKKSLTAPELRERAVALGLLPAEAADCTGLQETRLWCPLCGARRLQGIFGPSGVLDHKSGRNYDGFVLKCPACHDRDSWHESICTFFYHEGEPGPKRLLGGVKGFRPGLRRIAKWWNEYADSAARTSTIVCCHCGSTVPTQNHIPPTDDWHSPALADRPLIFAHCPHCCRRSYIAADERSFVHPVAQKFWAENPRTRTVPLRSIVIDGRDALLTRLESVTGSAALDIVCDRETLAVRGIYPGTTG